MEKGDKKKVKPKKKTQQKQKQKQEQNVIVNITQPVRKQRKRVYKPTKKIMVNQPIRNITTITQIPTERAELYRQVQQPSIIPQAPAQAPQQQQAQAPVFTKPKVTVEEEPLRAESKFIFEDPLISSSSMLYPEQNLELIKRKYKKVRPLEDYMSDISTANSQAEVKHEAEIFNNPNFYNRNAYDEEIEAEKIDEIDVGEPAGFSSVPIFTTDNLFDEEIEAEKINELQPIQQQGGDLMPNIQTDLQVGGGGEMFGIASGDMPEEPKEMVEISLGDVKSGGGSYSKQAVIDKWQEYINFLNSSNFEVEGSKELKKLKKYESGKEESNKKLKDRFDRYDKELSDRQQMFNMYNLMNESEDVLGRFVSREPTANLMNEGAFQEFV